MSKAAIGWFYFLALISQIILTIIFFSVYNSHPDTDLVAKVQDEQQMVQQDQQIQSQDPSSFNSDPFLPDILHQHQQNLAQDQQRLAQQQDQRQSGMVITVVFMIFASMLGMIAWIGTLINLSRGQQWVWFILTFFFGGIMLLIYLIGGPTVPKKQSPAAQVSASLQENYSPGVQLQQEAVNLQPPSFPAYQQSASQVPQPYPSALEVLQLRLARGEIDEQTYHRLREALKS